MDISTHLHSLQRQNADLQQEVARLRGELADVVDEYSLLEQECDQKNAVMASLGRVLADVSRTTLVALQRLWSVHTAGGSESELQKAVMSALLQPESAQKALLTAGLTELAALAIAEDTSDLMAAVQTFSPDSIHRHEKQVLTTAVGELDAERRRLHADIDDKAAAITLLQSQLDTARTAQSTLQHDVDNLTTQLAATQSAVGTYLDFNGRRYDRTDITALEAEIRGLRQEVEQLTNSVVQQASSAAGNLSADDTAMLTTIAQENASYLTRATEAEARAEQLASQLTISNLEHDAEVSKIRLGQQGLESANSQLTRTVTNLRNELEILQEKHAAREGVVDMLRQELADAHTRLSKLQAHKTEMAQKAATALREVEGQVHMLTAAVHTLKAQRAAVPPPSGAASASGTPMLQRALMASLS